MKKKKKDTPMSIVLDGEVYLKEGRKKHPIDGMLILNLIVHAIELGLERLENDVGK